MNSLEQIGIVSNDVATHAAVLEAICGKPFRLNSTSPARQCWVGQILIELDEVGIHQAQGLQFIRFGAADLVTARQRLIDCGIEPSGTTELELDPREANGIRVRLGAPLTQTADTVVPAHVDHVAVCVADLEDAARRWEAITDSAPSQVGEHPLGQFNTARFLLGPHMIELVSPKKGVDSAIAQRLASRGEGVMAVAIVAADLAQTRSQVEAAGARLVEDPPHIFVHPRDAAGLLVQLTPRLDH